MRPHLTTCDRTLSHAAALYNIRLQLSRCCRTLKRAAVLYNIRPHLTSRGSMHKKISVLKMYAIVQRASVKSLSASGASCHPATAQLLVTRVSPIYVVDEFTFFFLVLLNKMRMLGKSNVLPFLFLVLIKGMGRWSVSRSSHRKYSKKKLFLKILQYLQENTCVGVSF